MGVGLKDRFCSERFIRKIIKTKTKPKITAKIMFVIMNEKIE